MACIHRCCIHCFLTQTIREEHMAIQSILKSTAVALAIVTAGPVFAQGTPIDAAAFDALIAQGPVAELLTQLDAPLAQALPDAQQASIIEGSVCAHDAQDHLWSLQIGQHQHQHQPLLLHWTEADAHYNTGERVRLRVLARDVSLSLHAHSGSSILNSLPAVVTAVHPSTPGQVLVQLQLQHSPTAPDAAAPAQLLALVSARSARLLQLTPGLPVHAQLKGVAVLR